MDRQLQYDELRLQFNRIFNAEVPPFEGFRQRGEGLEAYAGAMTRIQSLWNTPRVLDVIEESLFRKPGRPDDAFGLEAYRELLLLYAIASEFIDSSLQPNFEQTDLPVSDTPDSSPEHGHETAVAATLTELQPLSASAVYGVGDEKIPVSIQSGSREPKTAGMGLDIDLTDSWLGVDSPDTDHTVILSSRKAQAFQPASSAWLDFDLSDIRPAVADTDDAGDAGGVVKRRENPPRT